MKKINKLLLIILIIGGLLRFIGLDQLPVGVSGDEIQQAYSAYSILKTGRDEWGEFLPLFPRGYGDYKPPLLMYLEVPTVAVFGLNEWGMRLPTAIFGVFLIWLVYKLMITWFDDQRMALITAGLMAISPWGIMLSRTAFEGGVGVVLLALGILALSKIKTAKWWLIAALSLGLSLYSYHSFKLVVPVVIALLWMVNWRQWPVRKMVMVCVIVGLMALPIGLNNQKTSSRLADVGVFSVIKDDSEELNYRKIESPSAATWGRVFDGKYVFLGEKIWANYLQYANLSAFFSGNRSDVSYLNFPNMPLLYPVELLTFFIGFGWLMVHKTRMGLTLGILIAAAPLAAILTHGGIAVNRSVSFLPWLVIVSGIGLTRLIDILRSYKYSKRWGSWVVGVVFVMSLVQFGYHYIYHLPNSTVEKQRYAVAQTFKQLTQRDDNYVEVVLSKSFGQPQIWVAYFKGWDPVDFQRQSKAWLRYETEGKRYVDQLGEYRLGKYEFRDLAWNDLRLEKGVLVAGSPGDFPKKVNTVWTIDNNRGRMLYQLVETDPNRDISQ